MEKTLFQSTMKMARIIFFGIFFQATIFSFWGLNFFITQEGENPAPIAVYVVFTLMALISFIYGIRFFQNYTRVKEKYLSTLSGKKLKEVLLLIYAIHILLIEFVAIIGILIAVFTQKQTIIYPFYFLSLVGLWFSYPRESLFKNYFDKPALAQETP